MLHAPTSETKTETAQGKTPVVPQPQRELHPRSPGTAGLYSPVEMSSAVSSVSPQMQRRQALAGMQSTHGNQAVLQMLHSPQQVARMPMLRPSQVMLQRKCACGGSPETEGECAECKAKREAALQRRAANQAVSPAVNAVPPIVHDVLSSPGQPLDPVTRAFMELRFGHDFSGVRVHMDAKAAESARAVNALAYTVGGHVAFGAGQYVKETPAGQMLVAHELAHVLQQRGSPAGLPHEFSGSALTYDDDQNLERDAENHAVRIMTDQPVQPEHGQLSTPALQRQSRRASPTPPPAPAPAPTPAPAPATTFVCGPDVTSQVQAVVADIRSAWGSWTATQRDEACWALENLECGPDAWDVVQLHNNAWIYQDYRPACASAGANPKCGSSIQVGADCHNAGSVNYVIFGLMCNLCNIWPSTMRLMIWGHKVHLSGLDADYGAAVGWANAGYAGWPAAANPPGDRTNCAASCPTAYGPTANNSATAFDFHWVPTHQTETVGPSCNIALFLRRNPPIK